MCSSDLEEIKVEAEIHDLEGFSGHADQTILMKWLNNFKNKPKKIFVVHGEKESSNEFAKMIKTELGVDVIVPNLGDGFKIEEVVKQSHTGVVLEPIKEREDIKMELQEVYTQFESLAFRTDQLIDPKFLSEDYDNLKNKLLELQQKLMDVNMLISK